MAKNRRRIRAKARTRHDAQLLGRSKRLTNEKTDGEFISMPSGVPHSDLLENAFSVAITSDCSKSIYLPRGTISLPVFLLALQVETSSHNDGERDDDELITSNFAPTIDVRESPSQLSTPQTAYVGGEDKDDNKASGLLHPYMLHQEWSTTPPENDCSSNGELLTIPPESFHCEARQDEMSFSEHGCMQYGDCSVIEERGDNNNPSGLLLHPYLLHKGWCTVPPNDSSSCLALSTIPLDFSYCELKQNSTLLSWNRNTRDEEALILRKELREKDFRVKHHLTRIKELERASDNLATLLENYDCDHNEVEFMQTCKRRKVGG